jgi:hypothetical protein
LLKHGNQCLVRGLVAGRVCGFLNRGVGRLIRVWGAEYECWLLDKGVGCSLKGLVASYSSGLLSEGTRWLIRV